MVPKATAVNASISGETSLSGRNRLPALLHKYHPAVLVIELGANDGLQGLSLPALKDNLAAMIDLAQKAKIRVLLLGIELPVNYGPQYRDGLRYMRATPLVAAVAMISLGWASGGGAAQILFSLFGEKVFHAGAAGIGIIWGFAGIGLLIGGTIAHWLGTRLTFTGYKRTIPIVYLIHGGAYVLFSQMPTIAWACVFIALSRAAVAISSVLNFSQLLHHVEDRFRGRVFATLESLTWSMMMISMMSAGAATTRYDPRVIGACSGIISSSTALFWWWADWRGKLPEPPAQSVEPGADREVKAEPPLAS